MLYCYTRKNVTQLTYNLYLGVLAQVLSHPLVLRKLVYVFSILMLESRTSGNFVVTGSLPFSTFDVLNALKLSLAVWFLP